MRYSIYFSAILGLTFLAIRFIGMFVQINNSKLFLFIGIGILLLVTFPMYLIERLRYKQKKMSILKKYQGKSRTRNLKETEIKHNPVYSSIRKQKRGLTWAEEIYTDQVLKEDLKEAS